MKNLKDASANSIDLERAVAELKIRKKKLADAVRELVSTPRFHV